MHTARATGLRNTSHIVLQRSTRAVACRTYADNAAAQTDQRASAKLFQDAANEEAELAEKAARVSRLEARQTQHENWTGEESMQDAVLRMLVDKYKPLRSGPIRTADEKLKRAPPQLRSVDHPEAVDDLKDLESTLGVAAGEESEPVVQTSWGASAGRPLADVPLIPSVEGHQPWQTTFTVPSHARSSIKYGNIQPSATTGRLPPNPELLDAKAKAKLRETKKRTAQAGRLRNARESTLDYRLGIQGARTTHEALLPRANPTGLKGWASLVEERIDVCSFSLHVV
jgi:DnaJ homolog subfamily C member 28